MRGLVINGRARTYGVVFGYGPVFWRSAIAQYRRARIARDPQSFIFYYYYFVFIIDRCERYYRREYNFSRVFFSLSFFSVWSSSSSSVVGRRCRFTCASRRPFRSRKQGAGEDHRRVPKRFRKDHKKIRFLKRLNRNYEHVLSTTFVARDTISTRRFLILLFIGPLF